MTNTGRHTAKKSTGKSTTTMDKTNPTPSPNPVVSDETLEQYRQLFAICAPVYGATISANQTTEVLSLLTELRARRSEAAEDTKRVRMIRDAEWITSPHDGVLSKGSWRIHFRKPDGGQSTAYGATLVECLDNAMSAMRQTQQEEGE